ncbi:alpha/beta hydrolase [Pseudomonas sp. TNT2022 ID233]|uniref:alpha/beta hydrolase n=1 Tax=Pseudomonas aphyarum TaxID=2942629 RepID=UPI002362CA41|nr:alpha/beta hydrolase [Pseudomonas aphyarum]MDD1136082.1 alpha/beta hydrolase [Pseudomonas aphyarum]
MSAETVTCEKGNNYKLHKEHALTDKKDVSVKAVPVESTKAVVVFVGGAGDKESYYFSGPYGNIQEARKYFDQRVQDLATEGKYKSDWLGYNEVKGKKDIQRYVLSLIPYKSCPVYIVGHSLGGWNGAHLTKIMSEWGYRVQMLVTLDPVGEGALVWLGSDIYFDRPDPVAANWVNIKATPSNRDPSDGVADFGEKWLITCGPSLNVNVDTNHANALGLFTARIAGNKSAGDLLFDSIMEEFS